MQPYDTPYEDGILVEQLAFSKTDRNSAANNPLYEATLANYDWNAYDEITNNLSLNWYLTDHWTVRYQFSVTRKYANSEKFIDPLSSKTSVLGNLQVEMKIR